MNLDRLTISNTVNRETVRTVSKLLLTVVSLVIVLYILTLLPGTDRLIPATPISFIALIGAIVTVGVVVLLLYGAPRFATLTRMSLNGPEPLVENLASVVYWFVVLVAVLVAHRGLAGAVTPFLDGLTWVYDITFLLLALPAVIVISARLYISLDPGADLVADKLVGSEDADAAENTSEDQTGSGNPHSRK